MGRGRDLAQQRRPLHLPHGGAQEGSGLAQGRIERFRQGGVQGACVGDINRGQKDVLKNVVGDIALHHDVDAFRLPPHVAGPDFFQQPGEGADDKVFQTARRLWQGHAIVVAAQFQQQVILEPQCFRHRQRGGAAQDGVGCNRPVGERHARDVDDQVRCILQPRYGTSHQRQACRRRKSPARQIAVGNEAGHTVGYRAQLCLEQCEAAGQPLGAATQPHAGRCGDLRDLAVEKQRVGAGPHGVEAFAEVHDQQVLTGTPGAFMSRPEADAFEGADRVTRNGIIDLHGPQDRVPVGRPVAGQNRLQGKDSLT